VANTRVLTSPGLVIAVALLLVNDWILKPALGNWWTGKLSDFAGLYAFPLLWTAFWPHRQRMIYALSAVAFLVWKSPLSDPLITSWNAIGLWSLSRVVDYTDLIALVALLPSYRSALERPRSARRRWIILTRRAAAAGMAAVAVIAFMATSTSPSYSYDFPVGTDYQVNGERAAVRAYLLAHEWESASRDLGATSDKLTGLGLTIGLEDVSPCGTRVTLIKLESSKSDEDVQAVQQEFEQGVILILQTRFPRCS
jgi:hypothetical protein